MFSFRRALVAGVAALGLSLFGAGAALAGTTHAEGTVHFANHDDTDFSGQTWALDSFSQHMTVTNVTQNTDGTYNYDVNYRDDGTFVTQVSDYVGFTTTVAIPDGAHGVMFGYGDLQVVNANALPDEAGLKNLAGFPQVGALGESQVLAQGGTINSWTYDYNYKIPGTSFTAEQSNTVNTP